MNISQANFYTNQYKINCKPAPNNTSKNNINTNNLVSANNNFAKVNAENYRANFMINFKGSANFEECESSGVGTLNHQSAFFRERNTDEFVQNYILENFSDEDEINIVSGACSTGEEAKSYSMMLDSLNGKLKISGFDISPNVIKEAKNDTCQLIKDDEYLISNIGLDAENILLTDDIDSLTDYERKCRDKFYQYYQPFGEPETVPVFPNAKQDLEQLEELLANEEELKKQEQQYLEQIQTINLPPELAKYMPNIDFRETMEMRKIALEKQLDVYRTIVKYKSAEHSFDNCSFKVGDVMCLDQLYKPNSINVLLYRNALYHTLCTGNSLFRFMNDDSQDTMHTIAKQMNKILKINGLVVFGEDEWMQGINVDVIKKSMENNGFKLFKEANDTSSDNIWIKTDNV